MLSKDSKIYIAGHHGLVGSAIWNNLEKRGYNNLVGRSHKELDLTDQYAVEKFFDEEKPDAVVLAAAFVGGIMANSLYRADFIMQNMKMQCNVISNAYLSWREEAPLPGFYLHLSEGCTAAYEGGCAPHFSAGIYQRGICHR